MIESERKTETRQVVFLVDTTAGLSPYWEIFKRNYIQPAVAFFSSMANPQVGQISNTLFSLVVYGSCDTFGGPYNSIREAGNSFMPKAFLEFIDNVELVGGGIDKGQSLNMFLSTASCHQRAFLRYSGIILNSEIRVSSCRHLIGSSHNAAM